MTPLPPSGDCEARFLIDASDASAAALNRECFCISLDQPALHAALDIVLGDHGLPATMAHSHPHLFSALPVFVSRRHIEQAARVVAAVEAVVALPGYQAAVMDWAPEIAAFDPGSPGGLLGLDFHLAPSGPRLIEINTNPGGVLLNAMLGQAQRTCMADLTMPPTDAAQVESAVMDAMLSEWRLQRGERPLRFVAIVDDAPTGQYLYPEFLLFQALLRSHGYDARICSPGELVHRDKGLWFAGERVDMVYNRLTDFALEHAQNASLRDAFLAGEVALSPHPRAHALYADKRNLVVLGDREFLLRAGVDDATIEVLHAAVPPTRVLTPGNREAIWANRRKLFFKPAAGFGGKASYRGDKLTRRVWEEMAAGVYVAQEIVAPSERHVAADSSPLKLDVRCYAYRGEVLLYAARMYQGQTTNFRTAGGGFAPVLTTQAGISPGTAAVDASS